MTNESIKHILTEKRIGFVEFDEVEDALLEMDELNNEDLDIVLIRNIELAFLKNGDGQIYPLKSSTWRWYGEDIFEGEYPLENLPEHVRSIAKELYYD